MLRDYEILYIVRPDVEEGDALQAVTKQVEDLIKNLDGQVQKTNPWGKRRLAYEVGGHREGTYVLTDFQIDPARVPEIESTLKISDTVFRHLVVRKPELKQQPATVAAPPAAAAADGDKAEPEPATVAAVAATPEVPAKSPDLAESGDVSPAAEAGEAEEAEE